MFIEPIKFGSVIGQTVEEQARTKPTTGFQDVFKTVWDNAGDMETDLAEKQYLQSIGEINDTHTVPIAASKAGMAVSLLVSLRNKALDSYNELMRINV